VSRGEEREDREGGREGVPPWIGHALLGRFGQVHTTIENTFYRLYSEHILDVLDMCILLEIYTGSLGSRYEYAKRCR
jgi:hypothetical protein